MAGWYVLSVYEFWHIQGSCVYPVLCLWTWTGALMLVCVQCTIQCLCKCEYVILLYISFSVHIYVFLLTTFLCVIPRSRVNATVHSAIYWSAFMSCQNESVSDNGAIYWSVFMCLVNIVFVFTFLYITTITFDCVHNYAHILVSVVYTWMCIKMCYLMITYLVPCPSTDKKQI